MRSRYLFKRKGSDNYYVRLQPPGQKLIERSLGTSDLKAAELAASDLIKQHKAFMYQRRQARVARVVHGPWIHDHKPGLHTLPDGGHVLATETTLTFTDAAGKITSTRPNGGPAIYLTGALLSAAREFKALDDAWDGVIGEGPIEDERPKLVAAKSSDDDKLLETYIKHADSRPIVRRKHARCGASSERLWTSHWRRLRAMTAAPWSPRFAMSGAQQHAAGWCHWSRSAISPSVKAS